MKAVFRKEPKVEVFKGRGGRFEGIHVSLQRRGRKACRGLTPNPKAMIDVGIDREDRPVFISLDEPVDFIALVRTIRLFLGGYEGILGRGAPVRRRLPITDPGTVDLLLRAAELIEPRLTPWKAPPTPRKRALSA